jgi:hypothetical protein
MGSEKKGRLPADIAHRIVQSPRLAQRKQGMPVIWHHNKGPEMDPLVLNREGKRRNNNFAHFFIKNRLLRMERFGDEERHRDIFDSI